MTSGPIVPLDGSAKSGSLVADGQLGGRCSALIPSSVLRVWHGSLAKRHVRRDARSHDRRPAKCVPMSGRLCTAKARAVPMQRSSAPYQIWSAMRARLSSRPSTASTSKMPGEVRPAGQRRAQRLGHLAELEPAASAKSRTAASSAAARPVGRPSQARGRAGQQRAARRRRAAPAAFSSSASGRSAKRNAAPSIELDQRLGALLQARHGGEQLCALAGVELRGDRRSACDVGQSRARTSASSVGVVRLRGCSGR